ncbi:MAG: hypothetical protein HZB91_13625 [Elusimicrobia bacterium]|nr:hypothetical protein [Elusimicrobiota bacterium]
MLASLGLSAALALAGHPGWAAGNPAELSVGRAVSFLGSLLDKETGLLRQNPQSKDYWLCPDNLLAVQALKATEAGRIVGAALAKHRPAKTGKFRALFGGAGGKAAFFESDLVTVARLGPKRVRTEKQSERKVERWNEVADYLFLAAIDEKDPRMGRAHFHRALRMWDDTGFLDKEVFHRQFYSAETLGLALIAGGRVQADLPMKTKILQQLARQQDASGGFAPDFSGDGKPAGMASAKTTSIVLLGLASTP